ncbi:sensor histidine kinase [Sutcliffiella halmapala]|uniref:sensor histidine kinase n=1 Tax=Sutcliffiella halmapala TaxID=79882 RepID=UPI000994FBF3|nr:histidine kinase [Sutcliffiella halmapala]
MKLYWIWLLFNTVPWLFAFVFFTGSMEEIMWRLVGVAVFFVVFFIMPLVDRRPVVVMSLLSINVCMMIITLYPLEAQGFNPFLLLLIALLIAEAFYRLSIRHASIVGGVSVVGVLVTMVSTELSAWEFTFITIYFILLVAGVIIYKLTKEGKDGLAARYDALLSEYRELKRRLVSDEEVARQEERMLIGHEIHDSVGHKLTALLMQLEVFRLKASERDIGQVESLKALANQSLEETRSAVKMLKRSDVGGLPGVLRLIRKLETESFIRIQFTVKSGAFAAPLTGEQSFIIYRSVQEALTNIMKHSNARAAEITFDAPGGSIFRFEISNPVKNNNRFQEGFGLSSMRERLEKIGGQLDVQRTTEKFIVSGYIKLFNVEEHNDSDTTS